MAARAVWKYPLDKRAFVHSKMAVAMAAGAEILRVDMQHGQITLWASVPLGEDGTHLGQEARMFQLVATGERFDDTDLKYLGTAVDRGFVWHLYEILERRKGAQGERT